MLAFLIVQKFEERIPKSGANLRGRPIQVKELLGAIVKDRDRAPALRFGFRLIEHVGILLEF